MNMIYDEIKIASSSKVFEMVCKDFQILDGLEISHKKSHTVVKQKNSTSTREKDLFTNQNFKVMMYDKLENLTRLQQEVEKFDEQFIVTFVVNGVELFFYAKVIEHSLENYNNSGLFSYEVTFVRTTYFIKPKNYQIDTVNDEGTENPYDYTYPIQYSGNNSTFLESIKTVTNKGIKEAPVRIEFFDESADGPRVGVNDQALDTFNSYISNVLMVDGDKLVNSNLNIPIIQKIPISTGEPINVAQERMFLNSRGYLYVPIGTHTLIFNYTKKAVITIYELYESVRGALS